jgi:hypothetical protein
MSFLKNGFEAGAVFTPIELRCGDEQGASVASKIRRIVR